MGLSHICLAVVLLCFVGGRVVAAASGVQSTMYVFGDIHLDPFYGTPKATSDNITCQHPDLPPYPMKGCDTSIALMEFAIADIFQQASQDGNGVMLITGDFLRHRMEQFDVPNVSGAGKHAVEYEIAHNITYLIGSTIAKNQAKYFGDADGLHVVVHPNYYSLVFGNEDCIPNYKFESDFNASAHDALPHLASGLVESGIMSPEQAASFSKCAFYATSPPGTNLLIIAINTVVYSKDHTGKTANPADPCGQFAWLEEQLNVATLNNKRVMILGHIIPDATKWNITYLDTYIGLMKSYTSVISSQWFGHTHMFTFLTESEHVAPPLFDVPGITPRDGNMPAYLKVSFTDQGGDGASSVNNSQWIVSQITERFLDVTNPPNSTARGWQTGMTFPQDFSSYPLTTVGLYDYVQYLLPKSHTSSHWLQFQQFYFGGVTQSEMSKKKKTEVLCKASTHTEADYQTCKKKYE